MLLPSYLPSYWPLRSRSLATVVRCDLARVESTESFGHYSCWSLVSQAGSVTGSVAPGQCRRPVIPAAPRRLRIARIASRTRLHSPGRPSRGPRFLPEKLASPVDVELADISRRDALGYEERRNVLKQFSLRLCVFARDWSWMNPAGKSVSRQIVTRHFSVVANIDLATGQCGAVPGPGLLQSLNAG